MRRSDTAAYIPSLLDRSPNDESDHNNHHHHPQHHIDPCCAAVAAGDHDDDDHDHGCCGPLRHPSSPHSHSHSHSHSHHQHSPFAATAAHCGGFSGGDDEDDEDAGEDGATERGGAAIAKLSKRLGYGDGGCGDDELHDAADDGIVSSSLSTATAPLQRLDTNLSTVSSAAVSPPNMSREVTAAGEWWIHHQNHHGHGHYHHQQQQSSNDDATVVNSRPAANPPPAEEEVGAAGTVNAPAVHTGGNSVSYSSGTASDNVTPNTRTNPNAAAAAAIIASCGGGIADADSSHLLCPAAIPTIETSSSPLSSSSLSPLPTVLTRGAASNAGSSSNMTAVAVSATADGGDDTPEALSATPPPLDMATSSSSRATTTANTTPSQQHQQQQQHDQHHTPPQLAQSLATPTDQPSAVISILRQGGGAEGGADEGAARTASPKVPSAVAAASPCPPSATVTFSTPATNAATPISNARPPLTPQRSAKDRRRPPSLFGGPSPAASPAMHPTNSNNQNGGGAGGASPALGAIVSGAPTPSHGGGGGGNVGAAIGGGGGSIPQTPLQAMSLPPTTAGQQPSSAVFSTNTSFGGSAAAAVMNAHYYQQSVGSGGGGSAPSSTTSRTAAGGGGGAMTPLLVHAQQQQQRGHQILMAGMGGGGGIGNSLHATPQLQPSPSSYWNASTTAVAAAADDGSSSSSSSNHFVHLGNNGQELRVGSFVVTSHGCTSMRAHLLMNPIDAVTMTPRLLPKATPQLRSTRMEDPISPLIYSNDAFPHESVTIVGGASSLGVGDGVDAIAAAGSADDIGAAGLQFGCREAFRPTANMNTNSSNGSALASPATVAHQEEGAADLLSNLAGGGARDGIDTLPPSVVAGGGGVGGGIGIGMGLAAGQPFESPTLLNPNVVALPPTAAAAGTTTDGGVDVLPRADAAAAAPPPVMMAANEIEVSPATTTDGFSPTSAVAAYTSNSRTASAVLGPYGWLSASSVGGLADTPTTTPYHHAVGLGGGQSSSSFNQNQLPPPASAAAITNTSQWSGSANASLQPTPVKSRSLLLARQIAAGGGGGGGGNSNAPSPLNLGGGGGVVQQPSPSPSGNVFTTRTTSSMNGAVTTTGTNANANNSSAFNSSCRPLFSVGGGQQQANANSANSAGNGAPPPHLSSSPSASNNTLCNNALVSLSGVSGFGLVPGLVEANGNVGPLLPLLAAAAAGAADSTNTCVLADMLASNNALASTLPPDAVRPTAASTDATAPIERGAAAVMSSSPSPSPMSLAALPPSKLNYVPTNSGGGGAAVAFGGTPTSATGSDSGGVGGYLLLRNAAGGNAANTTGAGHFVSNGSFGGNNSTNNCSITSGTAAASNNNATNNSNYALGIGSGGSGGGIHNAAALHRPAPLVMAPNSTSLHPMQPPPQQQYAASLSASSSPQHHPYQSQSQSPQHNWQLRLCDLDILGPIDKGASATVYKAKHKESRKAFAVKRIELGELIEAIEAEEERRREEEEEEEGEDSSCNNYYGGSGGRGRSNHHHSRVGSHNARLPPRLRQLHHIVFRELQMLHSEYRSAHVLKMYDAFYDPADHTLSIAMEYMHWGSLVHLGFLMSPHKHAKARVPLPERLLAVIAEQILHGLKDMHAKGHVHRDIKPGNVLVNDSGVVKLSDFGLVETVSNIARNDGEMDDDTLAFCSGTDKYMSPERQKGERHGPPSDVWALGMTLAECAIGKYPVDISEARDGFERMAMMSTVTYPPALDLSEDFRDFVAQCMLPNPSDRPTAEALLDHRLLSRWTGAYDLAAKLHAAIRRQEEYERSQQQGQQQQ